MVGTCDERIYERLNELVESATPHRTGIMAEELGWVLDSLVENAPAMLFLKRATDLSIVFWNKQAERISGVTAEEILGKTGFESFPADEMKAFHERDRAVLDGRRLVVAE